MIHITQSIETDVETDNYLSGFKYDIYIQCTVWKEIDCVLQIKL